MVIHYGRISGLDGRDWWSASAPAPGGIAGVQERALPDVGHVLGQFVVHGLG
jgi:hypothetical protein